MKKYFLLWVFASILTVLITNACNSEGTSQPGFTLEGRIEGLDSAKIAIVYPGVEPFGETITIAEGEIRNGNVSLSGQVDFPTAANIVFHAEGIKFRPINIVVDNEPYYIRGDFVKSLKLTILGGEWQEKGINMFEYNSDHALRRAIASGYYSDRSNIYEMLDTLNNEKLTRNMGSIAQRRYLNATSMHRYLSHQVLTTSDDAIHKAIVLSFANWNKLKEDIDSAYIADLVSELGPEHYYSKLISRKWEDKLYREGIDNMLATGKRILDASAVDADDKTIQVMEHVAKNKVTLLEFWASWCAPCRGEIPHIKETYRENNHRGFEVVAISIDKNENAWRALSESEQIPWINLLDKSGNAQEAYVVKAVPFNMLVDSQGIILAKNLRGDALKKAVEEYLN